ncbi:MAG: FGGY-family carbohydrate kinase [Candidatus Acidiferrales bacterium]|jgi:xylulokinase
MSLLAIDIGSSQCKAVVFTAAGAVIARSVCGYSPDFPQPMFAEMDPAIFWSAVCKTSRDATRDLAHDPVQALCLSSHGETFIPVNSRGEGIHPAILNIDNRATGEAKWCENEMGARRIFEITGLVAHPMYPIPKILWLRQHRPEIYSKAARFLSVTDFIHARLGLPPFVGYSLASRFLAFDVIKNCWSDEMLAVTGLTADKLPIPVPAGTIAGRLNAEAASALGVIAGTPVVVGGHDQACGALGVGVIDSSRLSDSMGTYECLVAASDKPNLGEASFAAQLNFYSHVVPGKFLTLAYFPSGIMVQWFRDLIFGRDSTSEVSKIEASGTDRYSQLEAECTGAPTGLCITPHLIGTCNPDFDPRARATIFGLSSDTTRSQIYQGILEGIACELAQITEILAGANEKFKDLYVTGGGTRSPLGLKLRAAITGCRFHVMKCDEAVCQGAAILAGIAAGLYSQIEDAVDRVVREKEVIEPDAHLAVLYEGQVKQYRRLCAALKAFRDANSRMQSEETKQ